MSRWSRSMKFPVRPEGCVAELRATTRTECAELPLTEVEKERANILKAITAGIFTASTKAELKAGESILKNPLPYAPCPLEEREFELK